jgi:poly-gamma-glutamate synthesis protein (capsule biosynthesis protein)
MSHVTLAAVGDLQLGDSAICVGYGLRSRYPTASALGALFSGAAQALRGSDVVFGNLECVLTAEGAGTSRLARDQMRGAPEYATALRDAGFTVLNVANNHAVQHGEAAFHETVARLRAVGIAPAGIKGSDGWGAEPVRLTTRGGTVGVLAYSRRPRQYGTGPVPYAVGDENAVLADIARLRGEVDHVVVSLHWGEEFVTSPSADEVRLAHAVAERGAGLLLGHHPHVSRPVERYGRSLVAYSLGNFAADMVWYEPLRRGLVMRCTLADGGATLDEAFATWIGSDFVPRRDVAAPAVTAQPRVVAMDGDGYARAIAATVREQQVASYRYAMANAARYRPDVLGRMVWTTVRNKLSGTLAP